MKSPCEVEAVPQTSKPLNGSFCPQPQRRFVLIAAILASALGFIDGSVVAIAIPAIRADLGASLADAQWVSNAYALTLGALILVGGAAGDRFGLRRTFVVGIAFFVAASAICAIAPDTNFLIFARALQGVGAAIMVPGSLAMALGALAYGLTAMTADNGGSSPQQSMIFVIAGLALLVGFIFWEMRQSEPMVDLSLFAARAFSGANLATFFLYFALSGILFYLPMLLIAGWGLSAAATGFIFLPLSAAIALFSGPVGKLSDRIGPRLPIAVGSLVVAAAFAGLAIQTGLGFHGFWSGVFPLMTLMGLGMALVVSPLSTAIMTAVEDKDTGAASGINNAVSRVAGLVAVAAMGVVAAFRHASIAGDSGAPGFGEPTAANLPAEIESVRIMAGDQAFSAVAWTTAALCVLAAVTAWVTVSGKGVAPKGQK